MKIVIETKNGGQFPRAVYPVHDDADYVKIIRASHPRSECDVKTVEEAMAFENEALAQTTQIIDRDEYETTEGWPSDVDHLAESLGWEVRP